jgi:hypothetical protein
MTIQYMIYHDTGYVHITGIGPQTMPEMIVIVDRLANDPDFNPSYNVIFDLRRGSYTGELSDRDDFVNALKRRIADFQSHFILLVPGNLHMLAKLYSVLAAAGGFDRMKCTTDLDEAYQWCGVVN